jgi:hypothetical protein
VIVPAGELKTVDCKLVLAIAWLFPPTCTQPTWTSVQSRSATQYTFVPVPAFIVTVNVSRGVCDGMSVVRKSFSPVMKD